MTQIDSTRSRLGPLPRCLTVCIAIVCVMMPSICRGQGVVSSLSTPNAKEVDPSIPRQLTIHPRASSVPALQYTLLPPARDLVDGNAALVYGKAFSGNSYAIHSEDATAIVWSRFRELIEMPFPQLLEQTDVVKFIDSDGLYDLLRQAALCKLCDWQLPIGKQPYLSIPLPEIEQLRDSARFVRLRTRIQIARGDTAGALESIQTIYAMARHAGNDSLSSVLVGAAIATMANDTVLEFIQQPESPNLYWAATFLPDPLFDIQKFADLQRNHFRLTILFSDEDISFNNDLRFWQLKLTESKFYWDPQWRGLIDSTSNSNEFWAYPIGLSGYSSAKEVLLKNGFDSTAVDAMPVAKVIVLAMWRESIIVSDEHAKLLGIPYYEASKLRAKGPASISFLDFFQNDLYHDVEPIHRSVTRSRRNIALIRIIEALREYTATHQGSWPKSLNQITDVSIPLDPMTGEPFWFETGRPPEGPGVVATLRAKSVFQSYPMNFEIIVQR